MATEVKLPELGDGIESGDVLEFFVAVGDVVTAGQDIVEMETDKATVPVPTSVAGTVTKIVAAEGDTLPIGGVILEIEAAAGAPATPEPPKAAPPQTAPPKTEPVATQQASVVPTVTPALPATPEPTPAPAAPVVASPPPATAVPAASQGTIAAGPAIRRFAREVGVDLSGVAGSGDNGRITRDDILAVVRSAGHANKGAAATAGVATAAVTTASDLPGTDAADDFGPVSVERMSKIRKTIAKQMHVSWSTVPRVTNFDDADITDLEALRQSSKEDYAAQGLKLTTMPFLIKAVATALRHHPAINAMLDEPNGQIVYKNYVNVGIAVDTDRGLVVPVMQNTDRMGVPEVARSLAEMAGKVRGGNFGMNDLKGGTFTISNLGAIGGQYSTPIVNVPEVAILLVGRSRKLPVAGSDARRFHQATPDDATEPVLRPPLGRWGHRRKVPQRCDQLPGSSQPSEVFVIASFFDRGQQELCCWRCNAGSAIPAPFSPEVLSRFGTSAKTLKFRLVEVLPLYPPENLWGRPLRSASPRQSTT